MALLPSSVIQQWYIRSSLVYRNFAFLFVNPLWQKKVPQGFSVCPFFWCALFSLFIFRPFVYLLLGVRAVMKALHMERIIPFTDKMADGAFRLVFGDGMDIKTPFVATMFGTVITLWFGVMFSFPIISYYQAHLLPLLLIPAANLYLMLRCTSYKGDCNVRVYPPLAAALSMAILGYLYPGDFVTAFVYYPIAGAIGAFHGIWVGLVWVIVALKTVILWTLAMALGGAIGALISLAVIAALGGVGYYTMGRTPVAPPTMSGRERSALIQFLIEFAYRESTILTFSTKDWACILRAMPSFESFLAPGIWQDPSTQQAFLAAAMKQGQIEYDQMTVKDREAAERKARRDAACRAFTTGLLKVLSPVITVLKHVGIFGVYLWTLIKSRKAGVCPYHQFTDAP